MTNYTPIIIGFAAGFFIALVAGKVLRIILIISIIAALGFLGYLRFFS